MMTKTLWLVLAYLSLSLAIIGIVLPLLPTTPFLILSASSFIKVSDKAYDRLMNHPRFGRLISQYMNHRCIDRKTKIKAISFLLISIIFSLILMKDTMVRFILIAIVLMVSTYIIKHIEE